MPEHEPEPDRNYTEFELQDHHLSPASPHLSVVSSLTAQGITFTNV